MASDASGPPTDVTWFLYLGPDGDAAVSMDVTHLRVHPSVTEIPDGAFEFREQLGAPKNWGEGILLLLPIRKCESSRRAARNWEGSIRQLQIIGTDENPLPSE